MMTILRNPRPVNLNLLTIHLPIAGVMSIAHRISGLLMLIFTPILIYGFDHSLRGPENFYQVLTLTARAGKLVWIIAIWALAHHFLAGIRYLLLDCEIGFEKPLYRWSATVVLIGGAGVALVATALVMP